MAVSHQIAQRQPISSIIVAVQLWQIHTVVAYSNIQLNALILQAEKDLQPWHEYTIWILQ